MTNDLTSSIQCDDQNKSISIYKCMMNTQRDKQNESMDILYEFPMNVQNEVIVFSEPTHVTSQQRKLSKINKTEKMFLRTGKYNIECFKKIDFSEQSWIKFAKYVHYNRHLNKLLVTENKRLQENILEMQSVMQTLTNTSSLTNNAICTPQDDDDDIVLLNTILSDEYVRNEQKLNEQQVANVEAKQDSVNVYMDHDYFIRINWYLTEYVEIVITYISDYIVSTVIKKINCLFCKQLLISNKAHKESNTFIDKPYQASCDVIEICKTAEKILKHNQDKLFKTDNILADLICQSLRALPSNIFNMNTNYFNLQLITGSIYCYLLQRLHNF
ncbi:PREDICTED: uncharacterized protein LOC108770035 [Trachymyrmex cornetzi]|uniref:uncharacterized protein LOC108770035 n=1 Tax=Trachymyrmex cornetzi TaxID=471704 RepID=UPI00084F0DEB|nr:PREDICTED: uncharacterized protein LOC108770035 [Trachymyrmex cornetzi]